ncbi:MAG TPA: hypothetical protein VG708_08675 [Mycobacteriales bacterium]|nr:hypothetical protein [Mycobacteriales bacterium]
MSARIRWFRLRSISALLTAAIVGVLALDTTTLVAAPPATASAAPAAASGGSGALGDPLLRLLWWSGYLWLVYPSDQRGPEPGVKLSDSQRAVFVDSRGRLHLHIYKENGVWRGAELRMLTPISYGQFQMVVDTAVGKLSKKVVLGMFVYHPGSKKLTNEIDIEDSHFPRLMTPKQNAQYVVQPYYARPQKTHWRKFRINPRLPRVLQQFTWRPGRVDFLTRAGASPQSRLYNAFHYAGHLVPKAGLTYLYLNLWLNRNQPPRHGKHSVVIRSFHFSPVR